ncbi:hypothetical protein ScPMuIL_015539 [Solemya velum]
MPVSDLSWNLTTRPPLFQVYGTKRKLASTGSTDSQHSISPKKRCMLPLEPKLESNEGMEINHNTMGITNNNTPDTPSLNQWHQEAAVLANNPQISNQTQASLELCDRLHNNNNSECHPSLHTSDMNMAHSETYSSGIKFVEPSHQDRNCSSMEEDTVPEQPRSKIVFCDQYCVGGDQSPTSGRVRCFCKPSWEGLMEMQPYVSDYY